MDAGRFCFSRSSAPASDSCFSVLPRRFGCFFSGASLTALLAETSRLRRLTSPTSPPQKIARKEWGLIGAAFGLGFVFGPAIGGILSRWGVEVPFLFAAGLCFANAALLYFTLPETVTPDHPARVSAAGGRGLAQLVQSLKDPRLGFVLVIYFLFIVAFSIMTTAFSLYTIFRFGYDAQHTGYLFAYVGVLAVIVQGGLIGRLVKRFGELTLVIAGASLFAGSLFAVPFVGPQAGGLLALLIGGGLFSIGNSLSSPSLTSLASKSVGPGEQGSVLGVTQSVASLARAVGPALAAVLIHSAIAYGGADGHPHFMSDHSLFVTFWTASAIMILALLLTIYYARVADVRQALLPVHSNPDGH